MPEQFLHGTEVIEVDDGIRAIRTTSSSIVGLIGTAPDADNTKFPLNTPFMLTGPRQAAGLGDLGTLKDAYTSSFIAGGTVAVGIRVAEGANEAETMANIIGDPTAMSGVWGFLGAQSEIKLTPKINAAPGFTSQRPNGNANAVAAAMNVIAQKLRSISVVDGPNTTETDAITARNDFGSDRTYFVDPGVKVFDASAGQTVLRPASGSVVGLIAKTDKEKGFWWSPSNQVIDGVVGTARPVQFALSDPDTEANRLNAADVATIVHRNGYRLWGNRGAGIDTQWSMLSVRRTADQIYDSIEDNHLWAMDRPFSGQLVKDIRGGVKAYLGRLEALGAVLGSVVWLDEELNTETSLKAGDLNMSFDFEPPAPLEHLIFRAHRNGAYYDEIVREVAAA